MATYYVDGNSGSDGAAGSSGSPWKTLGKANSVISPGDVVRVRTAVYYEKLSYSKNNVTFEADAGHTPEINGRYGPHLFGAAGYTAGGKPLGSHELPDLSSANATKGGWVVSSEYEPLVHLNAPGGTFRGFVVRNAGGRHILVQKDNCLIEDNVLDFCHGTSVLIDGTPKPKNVIFRNNTVTRATVKWFVGNHKGLVAVAVIVRGDGCIAEGNTICYNLAEGLALAKHGKNGIARYNILHSNKHCSFYINGHPGARAYGNVIFWCDNLYSTELGPSGRLVVFGDEQAGGEVSDNVFFYNNLCVGAVKAVDISGGSSLRPFKLTNSYIGYNTFVGRPVTSGYVFLYAVASGDRAPKNSVFENNVFVRHPEQTGNLGQMNGAAGEAVLHRNHVANGTLGGQLAGANSKIVSVNTPILRNPFARQIIGTFDHRTLDLPDVSTTFTPADYDLVESSPARGYSSNPANRTANGITLPLVNVDRYGAQRTVLNAAQGQYYDVGADEYGSDDPPPEVDEVSASFNFTPAGGDAPLTVNFADTSQAFGDAEIDGWSWDFDDGSSSTAQNPSHVYSAAGVYRPALTITDSSLGLTSTYTGPAITVTEPETGSVTARYTRSPAAGQAGVTSFSFTDTSTTTGDGVINAYTWDFRDGSTSTAANPTHTYQTPGTYRPRLTVRDTVRGYSSTFTGPEIVVTAAPPGDAVEAGFTQSATQGQAPLAVNFVDASLEAGSAVIDGWAWEFGDGYTSTAQNPSHTYATPGTYTPKLTVSDSVRGLVDTHTGAPIVVRSAPPPGAGQDVVLRQVRAALNTSNGNQTFTQAALGGLTPKSARLIITAATADGTAANGEMLGYGIAAGGAQMAAAVAAEHGAANTNAARFWTDEACLVLVDANGNEIVRATFVEWTVNGLTVDVQWTGTPAAYLVTVVLGAGEAYRAWAGAVELGGANTSSIIEAGFGPDAIHCVATWGTRENAAPDATISLGVGHRLGGAYVLERYYDVGLADALNRARLYEGYVAHGRYTPNGRASVRVSSWGPSGLTLAVANDSLNSAVLALVEKFGEVASTVALVDTGNTTPYALDWDPQYVQHIISPLTGLGAFNDTPKAGTIGIHTVTADGEFSNQVSGENGSATTNEQSLSDNQFIIVDHTGGTLAAGATTLGTEQYSIAYGTSPGTPVVMIMLAVEEGTAVGGGGDYVTAQFAADVVSGSVPLRVEFSDLSAGTNPITSWLWDFGDGATSTEQNPAHVFRSGGEFTVTLTVSDGTISDAEEKASYISAMEAAKRRIRIGPFMVRPVTESSVSQTHWDADSPDCGYMDVGLALNALRLNADPEPPTALPDEVSVYVDAASGDLKVKRPDESEGTIDVT